jgi:hypothetical protein
MVLFVGRFAGPDVAPARRRRYKIGVMSAGGGIDPTLPLPPELRGVPDPGVELPGGELPPLEPAKRQRIGPYRVLGRMASVALTVEARERDE